MLYIEEEKNNVCAMYSKNFGEISSYERRGNHYRGATCFIILDNARQIYSYNS